jgi:hypothetical protein
LSQYFNVELHKADLVDLSSSNTEEALALLSLNPPCGHDSLISNLRSSFDSDLFKDWPKANHKVVSVYIALNAGASSSRASMVSALCNDRKSCADGSSTQQSYSRAASTKKPRWQKTALAGAP